MINATYLIKAIKDYNFILKNSDFEKSTYTTQYKALVTLLRTFSNNYINDIENERIIKPNGQNNNILNALNETIDLLQLNDKFKKNEIKKQNTKITNDLMALVFEILLLNLSIQTILFASITGYYTLEDKETIKTLRKTLNEYYEKGE